ncbi:putative uncharacterized protein DDB_G0274405 [Patiria miniata]|uniref:Uncharacterized protein n=1 Tax=Patiria miniata TaxID=46514 RepID=A0A913ZQ38_PATMI|nr:putative uncharacterized protein DDB_G0274405 [Patiria miniata]
MCSVCVLSLITLSEEDANRKPSGDKERINLVNQSKSSGADVSISLKERKKTRRGRRKTNIKPSRKEQPTEDQRGQENFENSEKSENSEISSVASVDASVQSKSGNKKRCRGRHNDFNNSSSKDLKRQSPPIIDKEREDSDDSSSIPLETPAATRKQLQTEKARKSKRTKNNSARTKKGKRNNPKKVLPGEDTKGKTSLVEEEQRILDDSVDSYTSSEVKTATSCSTKTIHKRTRRRKTAQKHFHEESRRQTISGDEEPKNLDDSDSSNSSATITATCNQTRGEID